MAGPGGGTGPPPGAPGPDAPAGLAGAPRPGSLLPDPRPAPEMPHFHHFWRLEAGDEWQAGERRYLSEGSMTLLATPAPDPKEVATPALVKA